jgi:hypothetical protein
MHALPHELRLENEHVVLRDWRDSDAPALAPVCGEWDVCAFTSVPWTYSEAGALAWIERQRHKRAAGTVLALAIQSRDDDRALGNVNLTRVLSDGHGRVPEFHPTMVGSRSGTRPRPLSRARKGTEGAWRCDVPGIFVTDPSPGSLPWRETRSMSG